MSRKSFLFKMKQEISFWAKVLKFLNIPSGSVLGLFTLQIWIMMWVAFFEHRDIASGILTAYGSVLTAFTVHGVSKVVKGKENEGE